MLRWDHPSRSGSLDYKDYYATLGVPRDADSKAIKSAYRKLARKYHPDVNPGDAAAEERFKDITEANEVLGDPDKRAKYDQFGTAYRQHERAGGGGGGFDWDQWGGQPAGGSGTRTVTPEEFESLFGGGGFSDFFETLFGGTGGGVPGGGARGFGRQAARQIRGRTLEHKVRVSLEEAFHGASRLISVDGRRVTASIPPGVRTGSKVRMRGLGAPGQGGAEAGDLLLVIEVTPHEQYTRRDDDLRTDVEVPLYTAVLGGEIDVPTLSGPVHLTIPPETASGKRFRLGGKGMPSLREKKKRGDLIATVVIQLPIGLSDEERQLFENLRALRAGVSSVPDDAVPDDAVPDHAVPDDDTV